MSKFNFNPIQSQTPLYGTSNTYLYPQHNLKYAMKYTQATTFQEFTSIIQSYTLNSDPNCPSLLPIDSCQIDQVSPTHWNILITMPVMKQSLRELINKNRASKVVPLEEEAIYYLFSLLKCLYYLEDKRIAHGSIKACNILLDEDDQVYLANGRMIKFDEEEMYEDPVEPEDIALYMKPQVYPRRKGEAVSKIDAWSLGVIMLEFCLNSINLKPGYKSPEEKDAIIQDHLRELEGRYSQELVYVLKGLLSVEIKQRWTFKKAYFFIEEKFPEMQEKYEKRTARRFEKQNTDIQ